MVQINSKEIQSVINLTSEKRYKYFLNKVADAALIWGLYDDGWALVENKKDEVLIPLWPAKEYAELCASEDWREYQPKSVEIHEFIEEMIVNLKENKISLAIFYTPHDKGIILNHDNFIDDLRMELNNIE